LSDFASRLLQRAIGRKGVDSAVNAEAALKAERVGSDLYEEEQLRGIFGWTRCMILVYGLGIGCGMVKTRHRCWQRLKGVYPLLGVESVS